MVQPVQAPALPPMAAPTPSLTAEILDSLLPNTRSFQDMDARVTTMSQSAAERPGPLTPSDAAVPRDTLEPRDSLSLEAQSQLQEMKQITAALQRRIDDLERTTERTDDKAQSAREKAEQGVTSVQDLTRSLEAAIRSADRRYDDDQLASRDAMRVLREELHQVFGCIPILEQRLVLADQSAVESRQESRQMAEVIIRMVSPLLLKRQAQYSSAAPPNTKRRLALMRVDNRMGVTGVQRSCQSESDAQPSRSHAQYADPEEREPTGGAWPILASGDRGIWLSPSVLGKMLILVSYASRSPTSQLCHHFRSRCRTRARAYLAKLPSR